MPNPRARINDLPAGYGSRGGRPAGREGESASPSGDEGVPAFPADKPGDRRSRWLKLRWQLLSQWRGAGEPTPGRQVKQVRDVVGDILREAGLEDRLCGETVAAEWQQLVGSFIAGHSRPDSVRRGTLVVTVGQPTVRYALEGQRRQILQRLQQRFGPRQIRNVRFQIS